MFEFDLKTHPSSEDNSVQGEALRNAIARFVEQEHKTCWLQIQDEKEPTGSEVRSPTTMTSYHQYCLAHLTPQGTAVIRNYDEKGKQHADPVSGLLKGLIVILEQLKRQTYSDFIDAVRSAIPNGVLPHFASLFKNVIWAISGGVNTRKILSEEVLILIQLYCKNIGPLVMDVGNTDGFSPEYKQFLVSLATQIPDQLCLITVTLAKEKEPVPGTTIFQANVHHIVKRLIKKLIRVHFHLNHENEKKLITFILHDCRASNVTQAAAIVKNSVEVCKANSSAHPQSNGKLSDVNLALLKQHYVLPSQLEKPASMTAMVETPEEKRVRLLCALLGPYIKLDTVKKVYSYCFEGEEYPSDIDYSKISLVNNDGLIRYIGLAAYDSALEQQNAEKRKFVNGVKTKIHTAIVEGVMRNHFDALYEMRQTLPQVMEMRIQKAIIRLYGITIDKNTQIEEHGLSSSSDRVVEKISLLTQEKIHLTPKDLELIIHCFNELICYYSAKQDLISAFNYCRIIAEFLDHCHADGYHVDMTDIDLVEMISLKRSSRKKEKPYGKLDPSLCDPVISILSNLCMVSYFLCKYISMRKYIGYAYLLQNENSEHKPVIEACLATLLTQSAEKQLKTCIDAELDHPILNPTLPNQDLELYRNLRRSASALVLRAQETLLAKPLLPEQAFAWCLFVINSNFTLEYTSNSKHLRNAYHNGVQQGTYFKAILAFGNSILLEFCSGVTAVTLKNSCQEFLKQCDYYGIALPKAIIQGFLDFAHYSEDPTRSITHFTLEFSTEAPNHFFINFTRLLILFSNGDYSACVHFTERMRQLESQGEQDNSRVGYCIWRIFEWIEAVALVRYLEGKPEQQTETRIRSLRYAEKAFKMFAVEFPENFDCWYNFLMAELSRSELSTPLIHRDTLTLDAQLDCYDEALNSALRRGNIYCSTEISKVVKKIRSNRALSARTGILPPLATPGETAITLTSKSEEKTYDDQVHELVQMTGSTVVVLFIYNAKSNKYLPKLIFCRSEKVNEITAAFTGELFSMDHSPDVVVWHHPALQQAIDAKKVIYYSTERCTVTPFLEVQGIHNLMAIPILKAGHVTAVVYFHGSKNLRDLDQTKLTTFSDFAYKFFQTVNTHTNVLAFARVDNKRGVNSKSSASRSKTANTSASTSTHSTTHSSASESALTASGSPILFPQKNQSKQRATSNSITAASSEGDFDTNESPTRVVEPDRMFGVRQSTRNETDGTGVVKSPVASKS